ncbi:metallo-beta-lactamase domain-containing protein [Stagonosporopsis vannaccii]|nr:metallo-beta-lactamase domain-containing protein [Stagonosporopsis vannaccii]
MNLRTIKLSKPKAPRSTRSVCTASRLHCTAPSIQAQPILLVPGRRTSPYKASRIPSRYYSTQQPLTPQKNFVAMSEPLVHPSFEPVTGTFQYIVTDPSSKASIVIDPVLDFDPCTSSVKTTSADVLLSVIAVQKYNIQYILETHAHADHLSAASYIQARLSKSGTKPKIGIGQRIGQVQRLFGKRYGVLPKDYDLVFDCLFTDDETFHVGSLQVQAIHLPGHTPDHMGYRIGSNVFCGDSLFHADIGTARTDFPGGSAHDLWESSQKLLALPDETRIWTGHDYPPEGRKEPAPFMTVKQHREGNKHVMVGRSEEEFVALRTQRDAVLGAPRLLHQSLQINVRGGRLPEEDANGRRMIRVPLRLDAEEAW